MCPSGSDWHRVIHTRTGGNPLLRKQLHCRFASSFIASACAKMCACVRTHLAAKAFPRFHGSLIFD
jgi:hypothetical protein